jgi:hypothetical protein
MRPQVVTVGPLAAASATNIRTASGIAAPGAVVLNGSLVSGGVATMDKPRRTLYTFAGNEVGKSLVQTGTNWADQVISETIAGTAPGTVATVLDYKTITSVVASAAFAGNVSIGTNAVAASPWVQFDAFANPGTVAIQLDVTGTVNYTLQQTLDDPNLRNDLVTPAGLLPEMTWLPCGDATVVGATADAQTNYAFTPVWARVQLNSGSGSVKMTALQAG